VRCRAVHTSALLIITRASNSGAWGCWSTISTLVERRGRESGRRGQAGVPAPSSLLLTDAREGIAALTKVLAIATAERAHAHTLTHAHAGGNEFRASSTRQRESERARVGQALVLSGVRERDTKQQRERARPRRSSRASAAGRAPSLSIRKKADARRHHWAGRPGMMRGSCHSSTRRALSLRGQAVAHGDAALAVACCSGLYTSEECSQGGAV